MDADLDIVRVPDVKAMTGMEETTIRWLIYTRQCPPPAKIAGRLTWRRSQWTEWLEAKFAEAEAGQPNTAA